MYGITITPLGIEDIFESAPKTGPEFPELISALVLTIYCSHWAARVTMLHIKSNNNEYGSILSTFHMFPWLCGWPSYHVTDMCDKSK